MNIYIYEDEGYKNFYPLTYLRPVFDLYCGIFTFKERIEKIYNQNVGTISRFGKPKITLPATFINGRAIIHKKLPQEESIFVYNDEIIGYTIKKKNTDLEKIKLPKIKTEAIIIHYLWDFIKYNELIIKKDFELITPKKKQKIIKNIIGDKKNLYVEDATIYPGVYLNVENGPIYIEKEAKISPPTIIEGPCCIKEGAIIDGAKIRPGTTIGKYCRIGGEVDCCIFSNYSNKHHEGFIGHSYIGEWVNLGALTTTSDLKNTYGSIKVYVEAEKKEIDTGLIKLGSFIGDHTKTGIGTLLPTGCIIGCFTNIYGGGTFPKYIPSFMWGTKDNFIEYKLDKAIEVAKKVMLRRGIKMTKTYESIIYRTFNLIKNEKK